VTVVGGNATFNCSFPLESPSLPMWKYKAPGQAAFKLIHNGIPGGSKLYPNHLSVDVVETTAGKFSCLTLSNAVREFAGKYICDVGSTRWTSSEEELVVLGKSSADHVVLDVFVQHCGVDIQHSDECFQDCEPISDNCN
jgi:hypothetical protein